MISKDVIHFSAYLIEYFRRANPAIAEVIANKTIEYVGHEEFERLEEDTLNADKRRRAEYLIKELMGVLANGVPHKLNNLLMITIGKCDMIRSEMLSDTTDYKRLSEAIQAAEQAAQIILTMRSHARNGMIDPELLRTTEWMKEMGID